MNDIRIQTPRLELIAADEEMARAEIGDRARFAELLDAQVPAAWPPPLNDGDTMAYALNKLEGHPECIGWCTWHFVLRGENAAERTVIGTGGFYGVPAADGVATMGYSIVEPSQGRGYGTEVVAGFTEWAFAHGAQIVAAETLPSLPASIRVLEKNGFIFSGAGSEEGVISYQKTLSQHGGNTC